MRMAVDECEGYACCSSLLYRIEFQSQQNRKRKHDVRLIMASGDMYTREKKSPEAGSDISKQETVAKTCVWRTVHTDHNKKEQHRPGTQKIRSGATPQVSYWQLSWASLGKSRQV